MPRTIHVEHLLTVLDLGGTFVFAISGALLAVTHRLDIFGMRSCRSPRATPAVSPVIY